MLEANTILQQRNSELEQFAYRCTSCTDLQEPLRSKIRIFGGHAPKSRMSRWALEEGQTWSPSGVIRSSADRITS